jgi:four helix bundle protein
MRHEKTIVYQKSMALMETAQGAIEKFPKGFAFLADQLRRNTSSVHQNFAEGYYQASRREQGRYFAYAIQSAREASASFDAALAFRAADKQTVARAKALALEVVRILSKFSPKLQGSETVIRPDSAQVSKIQSPGLQVVNR